MRRLVVCSWIAVLLGACNASVGLDEYGKARDSGAADADTDADTDTDSDTDTDTDTDWVTIPAGSFWMGSPDGSCPSDYPGGAGCTSELGRYSTEELHYVTLTHSFKLLKTEVTQGDFAALMGWNPSYFGPNGAGADCGLSCPVENVSWFDSVAYANALSASESRTPCYTLTNIVCEDSTNVGTNPLGCMNNTQGGIDAATVALNGVGNPYLCTGYRLPTESEWEYAIRAGTLTAFYNGGITNTSCSDPNLTLIGWYCGNASSTTHPAGGKAANAWGLVDMSGNVYEWVWDWYVAAYPAGSTTTPLVDPTGGGTGSFRVLRGGGWGDLARGCRSAFRINDSPDDRDFFIGLRLARSSP